MRLRATFGALLFSTALVLMSSASAFAFDMNAGMLINGSFLKAWTDGHPNLLTVGAIDFKTQAVNYNLDPSSVVGDFAWDGIGGQPDYTMDPGGTSSQYVGHIGGATSTLSIGNLAFNPATNGLNFMTWYVDVPSLSTTDKIHFNLTSEQLISRTQTGPSQNLSVYLLGNVVDEMGYWTPTTASLNLTITNNGGLYGWAATWMSPPEPNTSVPEPSTVILLGFGLTLMATVVMRRRAIKEQISF